ncbi:LysR family transcriptional regulator [Chondromyces crocatus]|uniref:LysR family transcriptional regulator n=1 Tax=Chondromyces crocatus TaxID=52 RepID=A0A0K1ESX0_CHOCO|nr:LysR family transcriptional regulator [Chondromyces crocatus]AKT43894.1 LysR family transcriptional regulator [Chondromyces crocatus]
MLPSIDSLRCFVAAARLLNFRAAARVVALSPAALGQRIRELEEGLGTPLFRRSTRSVSLTEAGLSFLPAAERCLDAARDCVRAARGEIGAPPMEITLGTRHELGMSWLVPQLDAIAQAFPTLDLHLYFGAGGDLLRRVHSMEIDCAITSSRFTDPKLDAVRLHREEYVFVGAVRLLAERPLSREAHAEAHTLLDGGRELPLFRYWRDAPGGGDRLRFKQIVRLGGIEAIRQRVLDGAGVAVLPAYLVREDLAARSVRRIFPSVKPLDDWFRLIFRNDDAKRPMYEKLSAWLLKTQLT